MSVITVSRQLGSLGTQVAKRISQMLDCRFLDKQLLEEAFWEHGIPRENLERFDERKPAFWEIFKTDKARYLHFMKGAIQDFAREGDCVILGRGGQILLGELPGVMHVRIIAPIENRVERITERFDCDEKHAVKIIQHSDHERAGYHKFFFGENWEDLNLYDLVINTGSLSAELAAETIKNVVQTSEFKKAEELTRQKLEDLVLEHEIKTHIIYKKKIFVQFLEIEARNGVVTLRGIVDRSDAKDEITELVNSVDNVQEIQNEIHFSPITASYGIHY